MPVPDLDAIKSYLGPESSWTDDEITDALAAEKAAQRSACRIPADTDYWPQDLAQALKRRVARNLHLRKVPLGYQATLTDAGFNAFRIGSDSETRRLEAPYRRFYFGAGVVDWDTNGDGYLGYGEAPFGLDPFGGYAYGYLDGGTP